MRLEPIRTMDKDPYACFIHHLLLLGMGVQIPVPSSNRARDGGALARTTVRARGRTPGSAQVLSAFQYDEEQPLPTRAYACRMATASGHVRGSCGRPGR